MNNNRSIDISCRGTQSYILTHNCKKVIFFAILLLATGNRVLAQQDALRIGEDGKVGIGIDRPENTLDIKDNNTRTGVHPKGLSLYVTGASSDYSKGVEFRHFNGSQGIGFGYNTIYAAGSNANQNLGLMSRGSGSKLLFSTSNNQYQPVERMVIDSNGTVGIGTGTGPLFKFNKLQLGGNLHMNGNTIYLREGAHDSADVIKWLKPEDKVGVAGWLGASLGFTNVPGLKFTPVLTVNYLSRVGIGTANPYAFLEVGSFLDGGKIGTIFGRLGEGNRPQDGDGTYLGVRGYESQVATYQGKSFALEHHFYGYVNGAINFYRGSGAANGYMTFSVSDGKEVVRITDDQRVGIGTAYPRAKLEVYGNVTFPNQGYTYINKATRIVKTSGTRDLSILSSGDIATGWEFIIYSDMRIKKDMVTSDAAKDLDLLNRLRVTNYKYIDDVHYGDELKKGFIAQEVEKVFPQAVKTGEDFVPDIFSAPDKITEDNGMVTITMNKPHHLTNGDLLRLFTGKGQEEITVTVVNEKTFTYTGSVEDSSGVFVFGKRVRDFRMVDYDRLFTLNVSATQQLSKEIDKLKADNERIKQENTKIKNAYDDLQSKLILLEAKVDAIATPGTVSK